jgi:hypothetical protein
MTDKEFLELKEKYSITICKVPEDGDFIAFSLDRTIPCSYGSSKEEALEKQIKASIESDARKERFKKPFPVWKVGLK